MRGRPGECIMRGQALVVLQAGSGTGRVTSVGAKGIDCGQTCSHLFNNGTQVMFSATPGAGSTFAGFSGGGCSGTGTCTVDDGATVTATFAAGPAQAGERLEVELLVVHSSLDV